MRHVWVTGAGSGIGRAVAKRFVLAGDNVTLADIDRESLSSLQAELKTEGFDTFVSVGDITSETNIERMMSESREVFGSVNVLANCAGIYPVVPFLDATRKDWDLIMGLNLYAVCNVSQVAARDMISNRKGWIVNIASADGKSPANASCVYSASKAAVISLTRSMAADLAQYGILVNGVAPGWVATPTVFKSDRWKSGVDAIPLKRLAKPEEIADSVYFLCSEQASYITGEILNINGGVLMD
ncbi:MAG: SDR family oxidoreductase [Synergistaceae bacterium]|jgi:NAD(P)-dependent dehydrogenase (short-subunit alcohol dehydrogenase family)|nr:SDR family oxidoreductase [Synergistaceae bacterium]